MRFAYIDSNGNEVPIPSVDALALRVELGAIKADTELYDAHADQWGPAHTHEIFHTLSRAAEGGEEEFVAPPPPVAPPAPPADSAPSPTPTVEAAADEPTDEDPAPQPEAEEDTSFGLDLAPPPAAGELPAAPSPDRSAEPVAGGSFDFGDMSGGLELEEEFEAPAESPEESPLNLSSESTVPGTGGSVMDFSTGGLDLEQPMSEFSPDSPPGWMEAGPDHDEDVMDFSSVVADAPAAQEVQTDTARRPQRPVRTKPSPPKFKKRRNLVGPLVGIVILLSLGVGGYVAWPIVSARLARSPTPSEQPVFLPPIPENLLPQMREAARVAFTGIVREARRAEGGEVASPPREWLAGIYLANASRYPGVEAFWAHVEGVLERLRAVDVGTFHQHYEGALASTGVAADQRAALAERADSGFVAAAPARAETYRLVEDLIGAAVGLHEFLVANEDNIEFAPASTVTSDPVLEARPATPAIGEAMEERIDRVTDALDALDYLNLVTADGLWSIVVSRLEDIGVR